ncbi:MAG: sugar kinase [Deltaproteobacteria bacterium]|nr:sugar kinase [Deltaproteobacteria bacterium]
MAFDDLRFPMPVADPNHPGQTGDTFDDVVGGAATYASLAASCYGPVRVVAVVGDDFPEETLDQLRARQIDTEGVERAAGKTFRWKGRYREDMVGRDTLDTQLNVFADFRPKLPKNYKDTEVVLLGNIHPALQLEVLDQVSKPELVIVDTMNFWITGEPDTLAALLKRTDVLVINDEEARLLSGIHNIAQAAADILTRGPTKLIIKRGEYGALYFDADGIFAAPALPLETVSDPTGAGDSFAGGLVGYLARQGKVDHSIMRHAIVHGTATASYCVQAVGTGGLAQLELTGVEQRVKEIHELYYLGKSP